MPDLSSLADPLIEQPPCPAPPISQLRRRVSRRRRRRVLAGGAGVVAAAVLFVGLRDDPVRVVTSGPASPPSQPVDTSVLQPFHPVGPVTVVERGIANGTPWQLVVFVGSTELTVDGARTVTGPCSILLEARRGAPLPAGAGGCGWDGNGHDGLNSGSTGHGFARIGTTTFVSGEAGNAVDRVRVQLRDGGHVEAAAHAVEHVDGRYWAVALPSSGIDGVWLAQANEAVSTVVPLRSHTDEVVPQHAQGNYGLVVSNQSFGVPWVDLAVTIDGRSAVEGRFDVGNQRNWVSFQYDVEDGTHRLDVVANDLAGNRLATLERTFEVTGRQFGLVLFSTEAGEHQLRFSESNEPFAFG